MKLNEFLNQREVLRRLRQACAGGKTSLVVEFEEILGFDLELVRELRHDPTETLGDAGRILEEITKIPSMRLAVRGLGETLAAGDLRAEHIDKFVEVRGTATMVGFNKMVRVEGHGETKEFEDFQRVLVDDCLNVILKGDLVGSVREGDRVIVTGILGAINEGGVYGYGLIANHIEEV